MENINEYSSNEIRIQLIKDFSNATKIRKSALFIGSGISAKPGTEGTSPWQQMLNEVISGLGLSEEDTGSDLPLLTEFFVNKNKKVNRKRLYVLIENFVKENTERNKLHNILAHLCQDKIWTTNYDNHIQTVLREHNIEISEIFDDDTLTAPSKSEATSISISPIDLYQMHGSIYCPNDNLVITTTDYQDYDHKRGSLRGILTSQLRERVFLFLGFSFNDDNVRSILQDVASNEAELSENVNSQRYVIYLHNRDKSTPSRDIRFNYWLRFLSERKIMPYVVSNRDELQGLLEDIRHEILKENITICGSNTKDSSFDDLCFKLGHHIAKQEYILFTCFAKGVGRQAVMGAFDQLALHEEEQKLHERVKIWPAHNHEDISKKARETNQKEMIDQCGVCIFIKGGRGTEREFNLARKNMKFCIPLGYTGGATKGIYSELMKNFDTNFRHSRIPEKHKKKVKALFLKLGPNESPDNQDVMSIIATILKLFTK